MLNLDRFLRLFSDWSRVSLLYAAGILILLFVIQESVFSSLIRRRRSSEEGAGIAFRFSNFLRILRVFIRFEVIYVFLIIVKYDVEPLFPWNLIYSVVSNIFSISGILIPIYMVLNLAVVYLNSKSEETVAEETGAEETKSEETESEESEPEKTLSKETKSVEKTLTTTNRGVKFSLFFLAFSIILWNIIDLLPSALVRSELVRIGLLITGLFISFLILLVIQKVFNAAIDVLSGANRSKRIAVIIHSLFIPIQLITLACILMWLKQMIVDIPRYSGVMDKVIQLLLLSAFILFIFQIVETLGMRLSSFSDKDTNKVDKTFVELIRMIIRILIILSGVFSGVQIITGKPLTALLAGLGIGGLAVALAAQDTLKNFFGSIMIMTDKPFKIGERVQVNNYDGTIEAIGFRSTRIRTLVGNQVIIPNDQMASSSVENITRRPHIRRLTNITVTYGTTFDKMEQALNIIKNILYRHEGMNEDFPPRVYFNEYNADSLNILMIFWYFPPDYWKFMDFSESVNFRIMKEFSEAGIEFAFPTTTTVLEQPAGESLRFTLDHQEAPGENEGHPY